MTVLTIRKPDDWHIHLRDNDFLERTVRDASQQFSRVLVMPNLTPPVITVSDALAYRQRILNILTHPHFFQPYMTLFLTDETLPQEIIAAALEPFILAVKLYPAGATTHSTKGVSHLKKRYDIFAIMEEYNLPLCIHAEVNDPNIDIFDREAVFIDKELISLTHTFPKLRITVEHISTKAAVDFVLSETKTVAATITPQHLLYDRNDLLSGGIKPHYYCLPILKSRNDREALLKAATSGNAKFFLGTDSAPHTRLSKENACGCAGIYSAYSAIEFYAEAFAQVNALDKLENFSSVFGAKFYNLPLNTQTITLSEITKFIPETLLYGSQTLTPLAAGKTLSWNAKANEARIDNSNDVRLNQGFANE